MTVALFPAVAWTIWARPANTPRKEIDPTLVPTNAEVFPALSYEELAVVLCFSNSHAMSYESTLAFLKAPFERRKPNHETL